MQGCSVRDNPLGHTDIDAKRHETGPFLGALAAILDQRREIDLVNAFLTEVVFKVVNGADLRLPGI